MNVHPAASKFPLFDDDRLRELAADIAANGLREAIKVYRGEILDGRNRAAACAIAGVSPRFEYLPDGIDPFRFAWSYNGERRDLSAGQRYGIWKSCQAGSEAWQREVARIHAEANAARSEKAKERPREPDGTLSSGATLGGTTGSEKPKRASEAKAKAAGVDRGTVEKFEKLQRDRPDLADEVISGSMTLTQAQRTSSEEKKAADLARPVVVEVPDLHRGDFRELACIIPDESVELVFTDPPYDMDSVPLFGAAAKEAARILKPGGSMICYAGHVQIPAVLPLIAEHLRYWWMAACVHAGSNRIMERYGIRAGWKPLLWFVKETRGDVRNVIVDTVSGAREKDAHEWQQAEAEAAYFIEKLCSPNGIVVDFFAGGGTTRVAADRLGRRCIAFETNAKHYESASDRIIKLQRAA